MSSVHCIREAGLVLWCSVYFLGFWDWTVFTDEQRTYLKTFPNLQALLQYYVV